jgi:peptide deformylase
MLEIVKAPSPVLSAKAKRIPKADKAILRLISAMEEALLAATDPIGVGLTAPQVGKSLQLFIAKPTAKTKIMVFINPVILQKTNREILSKKEQHRKLEGCLSLVNIWGEVKRFDDIVLSYSDEKGRRHKRKFSGFMSIIIQHEIDHLNGILFPKRVLEQKGTLYKSEKDDKGQDVFEEINL